MMRRFPRAAPQTRWGSSLRGRAGRTRSFPQEGTPTSGQAGYPGPPRPPPSILTVHREKEAGESPAPERCCRRDGDGAGRCGILTTRPYQSGNKTWLPPQFGGGGDPSGGSNRARNAGAKPTGHGGGPPPQERHRTITGSRTSEPSRAGSRRHMWSSQTRWPDAEAAASPSFPPAPSRHAGRPSLTCGAAAAAECGRPRPPAL